jgi:hypothetical protein
VACRATHVLGNVQPQRCVSHLHGDNNSSWAGRGVQVVVKP